MVVALHSPGKKKKKNSFSRDKILEGKDSYFFFFFFDSKFFDYKTTSYFVFLMLTDELSVQLQRSILGDVYCIRRLHNARSHDNTASL